jgi:hypothetical protein
MGKEQEYLTEKAYIVETKIPIVFSRYTPDKVASKENVYLITKQEKNGSRIFLVPGVIGLIMFMQKKQMNEKSIKTAQEYFMDYFIRQIKGAYPDGNDVLIDGKKIMGMTVMCNNIYDTVMVRFILTMKSEYIKTLSLDEDFIDRKYKSITGVCNETGMDENTVRRMVDEFVNIALSWRAENAAD